MTDPPDAPDADEPLDLAATQRALAALVRAPRALASDPDDAEAGRIASGNERLTAAMQVDIYREQFFLRHRDVLREDFRSLAHRLGEAAFDRLAEAYWAAFPPSSFTLRDLGHALPGFVRETEPWANDTLLADLAEVEWAFVEAFDAADAPTLDLGGLAAVREDAWAEARVVLHPSVRALALGHPAHDYRRAVREAKGNEAALVSLAVPAAEPAYVAVYRSAEQRLFCRALEAPEHGLLVELARGTPLGEACEGTALASGMTEAAFEAKLGAWFQEWTALGWISRLDAA